MAQQRIAKRDVLCLFVLQLKKLFLMVQCDCLENHRTVTDCPNGFQCHQWVTEVIEDTHKENKIKPVADSSQVIYRVFPEIDIKFQDLRCEFCPVSYTHLTL